MDGMHGIRERVGWLQAAAPALLYCLGFALLRLWLSPTIGVDDVEQIIVSQDWRLGYMPKQPPLYSWYLRALADVVGPGLPALVIAKYTLLFGTLVFTHRAAALLLHGRWMPLLATGSLGLFYLIGYQAHIGFTHTAALMFVTALSFWLLLELCRRPSLGRYLAFGVCLGLGLLSKYNFAGVAAAMLLAAWLDPMRRTALRDRRMLLSLAAAVAVFLPYGVWLLLHRDEVSALYTAYVAGGSTMSPLTKRLAALWALLKASLEVLLPFLVLVPAVYRHAFNRFGWRRTWQISPELRLTAWLVAGGIALLAVLALVNGTRMVERYMVPYLMFSPILLLALVEARVRAGAVLPVRVRRAEAWHGGLILALIAVAALALSLSILRKPPNCGHCRLQKPFAGLAERLAGTGPGTLIAGDEFIGGNLAPSLPLRTYSLAYPSYAPKPAPQRDGVCLMVWDAAAGDAPPLPLRAFAERIRGVALPEPLAAETISVPYATAPAVSHAWRTAALPAAGDCR